MNKKKQIIAILGISLVMGATAIFIIPLLSNTNDISPTDSAASEVSINFDSTGITVGAIRYDAWFPPPKNYGKGDTLNPQKWHHRLPFYAEIINDNKVEVYGDSQNIVDQEILYAAAGGLDYWAFDYYDRVGIDPRSTDPNRGDLNYGLRYYLKSKYNNKLNYALNVSGSWAVTQKTDWYSTFEPHVLNYIDDKEYQTVMNGRPLVYFYKMDALAEKMGSEQALTNGISSLRKKIKTRTGKDPYIVGLLWGYTLPTERITKYGVDAVSAYTASKGNPYNNGTLWPYSKLVESNINFWNRLKTEGVKQIPIINTGWDYRPHIDANSQTDTDSVETYANNPLYEMAKPWEIRDHLRTAVTWIRKNLATAESKTVLIYSWSEYPEGGWLSPTLFDGDDRLRAIAFALGRGYEIDYVDKYKLKPSPTNNPKDLDTIFASPTPGSVLLPNNLSTQCKVIDFDNNKNISITDFSAFTKLYKEENLVIDLNKDNQRDIFDFAIFVELYNKCLSI